MTSFKLERLRFEAPELEPWSELDSRHKNWPVVYVLNNEHEVYVGETLNAKARLTQHLESDSKQGLEWIRVVLDDEFNKSVCLDLESYLIRLFAGDGSRTVLNRNAGITNADYFDRDRYNQTFKEIFQSLKDEEALFAHSLPEIINSDLFKLSPFKALNSDQAIAVENILEGLFTDLEKNTKSLSIVKGGPGTGKTVVAIYLIKLLEDIKRYTPDDAPEQDSIFNEFFTRGHPDLLKDFKIGFVIPQQSLRDSVSKVFKLTPGMNPGHVLTPFDIGGSKEKFDLVIVDESHRLNHRANQPSGPLNRRFSQINRELFGSDDDNYTQLDWILEQSKHVILMLDAEQSVRPADLPLETVNSLLKTAETESRLYPLVSQMRVEAGEDYIGYIRQILSNSPPVERRSFETYDLKLFENFEELIETIRDREDEHGLARLVAGYAWEWVSKGKKSEDVYDIEIDEVKLRWNTVATDWINSPNSLNEVGSIHTVQGYDLNYAGVIIGKDLRYDEDNERIYFDRSNYYDKKGVENNKRLGITYDDEAVLRYVQNIYSVLLTRGIRGTYVYVCDKPLRRHLKKYL